MPSTYACSWCGCPLQPLSPASTWPAMAADQLASWDVAPKLRRTIEQHPVGMALVAHVAMLHDDRPDRQLPMLVQL